MIAISTVAIASLYLSLHKRKIKIPIAIPKVNVLSLKPNVIIKKMRYQIVFFLISAQKVSIRGNVETVTSTSFGSKKSDVLT